MTDASGQRIDIAVVGAGSAVGETVLELLREREFPFGKVHALAAAEAAGGTVAFGNRELVLADVAGFDFASVQLALFTGGAALAADYAAKAAAAGCVVIDHSTQFRLEADVPLVIPEVNPEAIANHRQRGLIASPNCVVTPLLLALKPLHAAAGLTRVHVCTYQSASGAGKEGVEELGKQTADLLSFRGVEPKVFPQQLAFNLIPQIGGFASSGHTHEELSIIVETRRLLGELNLAITPTAVRVPVFYGHAIAVHLETRSKLSAAQARALLERAPGVTVIDEPGEGAYPTPVGDASGQDAVFVGRVRDDLGHPQGLNLWVVADNLRKGSALNLVQIAEHWFRSYR